MLLGMSDSLLLRRAALSDASRIRDFQLAMARETEQLELDAATTLRGVTHVLEHPALGFYCVAERANALVGCALVLSEWSDWRAREVWWIHSVYFEPAARGQGAFSALFREVEAEARARGVPYLRLYVERANQHAQRVYEALGMNDRHYAMYEKSIAGSGSS
jgi:ribosomal protein S18 acetylase RimI-like enzyme